MEVIEYPKIETLFNRDKATFTVIESEFRLAEFGIVKPEAWIFQEKIDGTNIRIGWDGAEVFIGGRTANAQMPGDLAAFLAKHFTPDRLRKVFPDANPASIVILFGEGYGPGIQKNGAGYRADKGFILFDVMVGPWWLEFADVQNVAAKIEVPVVQTYEALLVDVIERVRDGVKSLENGRVRESEGIVARSVPTLFTRYGTRVMWKLKTSDFRAGKR
jgi:hypothetical protein